ncbi:MAG: hypothetical protein HRU20_29445 [Pseudomonadales bacterium]|nr:hypothetical protein [Pseudomonadales bacterium]
MVLTGCGFKEGAEVTESEAKLICLSQQGFTAPDLSVSCSDYISDEVAGKRDILA